MTWERIDDKRRIRNDGFGEADDRPEYFFIRRVYGWKGELFPRIVLSVVQQAFDAAWQMHIPTSCYLEMDPKFKERRNKHERGTYELFNWVGLGFSVGASLKPAAGEWWTTCREIPPTLLPELIELLQEYAEKAPQKVPKYAQPEE